MKYFPKLRVSIIWCRLSPLPLAKPILVVNVQLLIIKFGNSYPKGDRVLYVSPFDRDENIWILVTSILGLSISNCPMSHLRLYFKMTRIVRDFI